MSISAKLRVIGLNTNLYYKSDVITEDMPDPGCQFQWLDDQLTGARQNGTKVADCLLFLYGISLKDLVMWLGIEPIVTVSVKSCYPTQSALQI